MTSTLLNPTQILDTYRKSDAVLIVRQNNSLCRVEILAANEEATRVTGYGRDELAGQELAMIFPARIRETFREFVEYGDNKEDLLAVASRMRDVSVQPKSAPERPCRLRIIRGETFERDPTFHLVLIDEQKLERSNALRAALKAQFKAQEQLDGTSNLPDRASFLHNVGLLLPEVTHNRVSASLAFLDINQFERLRSAHGTAALQRLFRHVGEICTLKLRPEDTVCMLTPRILGLILIDAEQEATRMVLNRLRWAIGVTPLELGKETLIAQVNIGFTPLGGTVPADEVLEACEAYMMTMRDQTNNAIQLIVTHNRRGESEDRRKVSIPVAVERRRKERRKIF